MIRLSNLTLIVFLLASLVFIAPASAAPSEQTAPAWQPNTYYAVGALVTYGGQTYQCRQAHTSLVGWEPPNVLALWLPVSSGPTNTPSRTPTRTNTVSGPTSTFTRTPTRTNTLAGPTNTPSRTPTRTNTLAGPTSTFTRTPTRTNTIAAPSNTPTSSGSSCSGLPQYVAGTAYSAGQNVQNINNRYRCDIAGWCSSSAAWAYAPGTGQYWTDAWTLLGPCTGGATNTPTRTNTPSGPTVTPSRTPTIPASGLPKHILVGYWHNFDNGSGFIRLRNVSTKYDVINIAFAEPIGSNGTIGFTPYSGTSVEELKSDVAYLRSLGKKVLISIGGQNGQVQLTTSAAASNFVSSVSNIISTYGLDGLDIDFEGHSLVLNTGDADFTNPTTPVIVNTINAIRGVRNNFGSSFILSMAPETFFVQLGYTFYGGTCLSCDTRAGAYLPVIYATRDILTYIHVQDYNSGPITALDNAYYSMGNADFHVAMTEMLLTGFPVSGTGKTFPALRQDQVAFGVPATVNAGNGYVSPAELQKALDYLVKGVSFGGSYRLRNPSGYPNLRGIMTWSINWDAFSGFSFSNPIGTYIDNLP